MADVVPQIKVSDARPDYEPVLGSPTTRTAEGMGGGERPMSSGSEGAS